MSTDIEMQWQPSAPIKNLLARAKIISDIRRFFTDHDCLKWKRRY